VTDLINDISEIELYPNEVHKMGQMVFAKTDNSVVAEDQTQYHIYEVTDGQQRLTSIIMYLNAIYKAFSESARESYSSLYNTYMFMTTDNDEQEITKLQLFDDIQDFFFKLLEMPKLVEEEEDEEGEGEEEANGTSEKAVAATPMETSEQEQQDEEEEQQANNEAEAARQQQKIEAKRKKLQALLQATPQLETKIASHKRLLKCYNIFAKHIANIKKSVYEEINPKKLVSTELDKLVEQKQDEALNRIYLTISQRLVFTVVVVSEKSATYSIFESLNARGKALNNFEKLKNFLHYINDLKKFGLANQINELWLKVSTQLSEFGISSEKEDLFLKEMTRLFIPDALGSFAFQDQPYDAMKNYLLAAINKYTPTNTAHHSAASSSTSAVLALEQYVKPVIVNFINGSMTLLPLFVSLQNPYHFNAFKYVKFMQNVKYTCALYAKYIQYASKMGSMQSFIMGSYFVGATDMGKRKPSLVQNEMLDIMKLCAKVCVNLFILARSKIKGEQIFTTAGRRVVAQAESVKNVKQAINDLGINRRTKIIESLSGIKDNMPGKQYAMFVLCEYERHLNPKTTVSIFNVKRHSAAAAAKKQLEQQQQQQQQKNKGGLQADDDSASVATTSDQQKKQEEAEASRTTLKKPLGIDAICIDEKRQNEASIGYWTLVRQSEKNITGAMTMNRSIAKIDPEALKNSKLYMVRELGEHYSTLNSKKSKPAQKQKDKKKKTKSRRISNMINQEQEDEEEEEDTEDDEDNGGKKSKSKKKGRKNTKEVEAYEESPAAIDRTKKIFNALWKEWGITSDDEVQCLYDTPIPHDANPADDEILGEDDDDGTTVHSRIANTANWGSDDSDDEDEDEDGEDTDEDDEMPALVKDKMVTRRSVAQQQQKPAPTPDEEDEENLDLNHDEEDEDEEQAAKDDDDYEQPAKVVKKATVTPQTSSQVAKKPKLTVDDDDASSAASSQLQERIAARFRNEKRKAKTQLQAAQKKQPRKNK